MGLWLVSLFVSDLTGLVPGLTPQGQNVLINAVYYLPFLVLPAVLYARRTGDAAETLRLYPLPFGAMIRVVIAAYFTVQISQSVSTLWMIIWQKLGLNVFVDSYIQPSGTSELTLSIIASAVLAPIGEELLFRGAMLSAWESRGAKKAVLTTTVLFAMMHGSLLGLPGELFGGLMLGLVVLWTDSIYAGLAFHTTYNAIAILMDYVSSSTPVDAAAEALMHSDILAALGGYDMVLVLLVDILLSLLVIVLVTRRLRMIYAVHSVMRYIQNKPEDEPPRRLLKPGQMFIQPPPDPAPISTSTALVLMAGIVSALGMYALDILSMLGG